MKIIFFIILLGTVTGCGGFRGGIESVPYAGDTAPQGQPSHPSWPHTISLPRLTIELSLNNALRTYQYEVMLFVIPTYLNFWDEFRNREAVALEISLQLEARETSMVVDLHQLVLTVGGREVHPSGVWVNNPERERRVIDEFVKARREAPKNQPPPVPRSSEWRDAITGLVSLGAGGRSARFIVVFPLPLLSPENNMTLNLRQAVIVPTGLDLPLIHFRSTPWSEGYS